MNTFLTMPSLRSLSVVGSARMNALSQLCGRYDWISFSNKYNEYVYADKFEISFPGLPLQCTRLGIVTSCIRQPFNRS